VDIAFVNSTHKWGGVKTWIIDIASLLKNRNNVMIFGRRGSFVEVAVQRGVFARSIGFGADFNPFLIVYFLYIFKKFNVDVVFCNVGKDMTTAGVAAKFLDIPVIQQIGLPADIPHTRKMELLHKWINPWFLCTCEFIRDGFVKSLPYVKADKTKVILTAKNCAEAVTPLGRPMRIIMTSQLNPDKGHALILGAITKLKGDFTLRIVGTGHIEKKLHALAEKLGVSGKVEWCGFSTDVRSHLREADIFVMASSCEGLPNTLQEAMSEGLVPVCRDVGGCREVWPEELEDLMLPFDAPPEAYATVLQRLLDSDAATLQGLKAISRDACVKTFSLVGKVAELEQWLSQAVVARKPG